MTLKKLNFYIMEFLTDPYGRSYFNEFMGNCILDELYMDYHVHAPFYGSWYRFEYYKLSFESQVELLKLKGII